MCLENFTPIRGISPQELRETLQHQGINLVYKVRKNMKHESLFDFDAQMLKRRMILESVIKELKIQTQAEHIRHRSFVNFQVNLVSALIAYTYLEKKPALNLQKLDEIKNVPVHLKF